MAMTAKDYTNKKIADANKKTKLIREALKKKLPVKKYLEDNMNKSNATVVTNKLSKKEAIKSPNTKTVNNNKGAGNSNTDISKGSILTRVRKNVAGLNLNAVNVNSDSPVKKSKDIKKDKKVVVADKKDNKTTKSKTAASASNTKNFASTMAMQKKLIAKGAKIKADGIMGPKTRAAMAKYMKAPVPKSRPTKPNVSSNKKTGIDSALGDNSKTKKKPVSSNSKLDSKGNYKGTNIKPTKLQLDRMRKKMMGAT